MGVFICKRFPDLRLQHLCSSGCTRSNLGIIDALRLYEIPIPLRSCPSRKHMPQVAPHRASKRDRTAIALLTHLKSVSRRKGAWRSWRAMRPRRLRCWTSSCWPLALASSRCRSATRSPAIASEENSHDLRLFARGPRHRRADDLPHLRSAQARAVLKGLRP
jgi:hypothetical protein